MLLIRVDVAFLKKNFAGKWILSAAGCDGCAGRGLEVGVVALGYRGCKSCKRGRRPVAAMVSCSPAASAPFSSTLPILMQSPATSSSHSEGESLLWREERKETRKNLTSSKRWHRGDHGTLVSKVRRPCYQAQRLGQNAAGSPGQRRLWHREEQSEEALLTRLLPWAKMPPARLGDLYF